MSPIKHFRKNSNLDYSRVQIYCHFKMCNDFLMGFYCYCFIVIVLKVSHMSYPQEVTWSPGQEVHYGRFTFVALGLAMSCYIHDKSWKAEQREKIGSIINPTTLTVPSTYLYISYYHSISSANYSGPPDIKKNSGSHGWSLINWGWNWQELSSRESLILCIGGDLPYQVAWKLTQRWGNRKYHQYSC